MKCDHTCIDCGVQEVGDWIDTVAKELSEKSLCHSCNHWRDVLSAARTIIIDGHAYSVGNEPIDPRKHGGMLGMAGRRFDIELSDGRRFTTHNLWYAGGIPDRIRDKHPDTASFVTGGKAQVGPTTCWEGANEKQEKYPTYAQVTRIAS